ncbi:hypothetical protein [Nonomuraea maheshkhaliensis]|uniref:hypothetical protein n=1 Tax=Nonomuraea maheshkhaliensis TaxID=419590 RepID=UPI0031F75963
MPGAPPWEPPPAFTAAAAGMPVWPAPLSDPHAMPPWPAATGELVADPDSDEPGPLAAPFDASATQPEGLTHPAHYFDPDATQRDAIHHLHADDTPPDGMPAHKNTAATPTGHAGTPGHPDAVGHSGVPGHPGAPDHPGIPGYPGISDPAGRPGAEGSPATPPGAGHPHDRELQDPQAHDGRPLTPAEHDRAASAHTGPDDHASGSAHAEQASGRSDGFAGPGGPEPTDTVPGGLRPGSPEPADTVPGGLRPSGPGSIGTAPGDTVPGGLRPGVTVSGRATSEDAHPGDPQTTDPHSTHDQTPGHGLSPVSGQGASQGAGQAPGQGTSQSGGRGPDQGSGQGVSQGPGAGSGQGPAQGPGQGRQGPGSKPSELPYLPAPIAATRDPSAKPAHYFDPNAAKTEAASQNPPFDPNSTNPSVRPPEPGDVPVWPPNPPTGDKLPELPFSRDTWGHKPSTSFDVPKPPAGGLPFPPGAFKQPPFQTPPPPPPPPRSKRALLVTLGALALAGVATGGFFAVQAMNSAAPPPVAASPAPASPSVAEESAAPPADLAGTSVLDSEESDPQKLSLSEAFPKKKVSAAGTTFTRVKAHMETTCDKAATGAFADALKEQKCSRVLRATYVDSKRRYAVTTGLAVLPDKNAATTADQAKDLSNNVWFRPLPGASGSGGERVHIAGGYAAGLVWGRYIVFSYATYADGHTPTAKEKTLPKVSGAFRDQISLVLERRITKG